MIESARVLPSAVPHGAPRASARRHLYMVLAALPVFFVLVTANSAGYRYGTSDQAFYIPAIQHALEPASFPRDAAVVVPQSDLLASDQIIAWMVARLGLDLPAIFFGAYLVTCAVFAGAVLVIGSSLYTSWWTTWTLLLALTLRHRIAETGVNTFEGAFHPRVLTFSLGMAAVAAILRERAWLGVALVAVGFLVHPTTALWFAIWLGGAALVSPRGRRVAIAVGLGAGVVAGWMLWAGPLAQSLRIMDAAWTAPLATKDYLFPTEWSTGTWLTNAIAPLVLVVVHVMRSRRGLVSRAERSVFVGAVALLAVFAASLPFISARVAIAVQLQTSRVLWPIELLATVYLVWVLAEATRGSSGVRSTRFRRAVVASVIGSVALARGAYVLRVEHDRPLVTRDLPQTAWQDAATWATNHTPMDAHFLVDPGHAWKYDVSFRVAAQRDVFLEEVKDAAMATYARDVALRVTERTHALGDFASLTPQRASELADRYDIDFLIADRPFPFPVAFANSQFTVYALPRTGARQP